MQSIVLKGLVIRPSLTFVRQKGHLAVKVQEHLSGKFAIHEHISPYKDCHSGSINKFCTLAHTNTDFKGKIKEAMYIRTLTQIKQLNKSLWFFIPAKYSKKHVMFT